MLCSYGNNQGFAYPNLETIAKNAHCSVDTVSTTLTKLKKKKAVELVSKYRSHPKWKHVMGSVYRIVYDERLNQSDLIDDMNKEDPPPIEEEEIKAESNQETEGRDIELVEIRSLATHYVQQVRVYTGELRLLNERAYLGAELLFKKVGRERANRLIEERLTACRKEKRGAPQHCGELV